MMSPSQLMLTSILKQGVKFESLTKLITNYQNTRLAEIKQHVSDNCSKSKFKPVILKLIHQYQQIKIHNVESLKIIPLLQARQDIKQLPRSPQNLKALPLYAFKLVQQDQYELSGNNRMKKAAIIDSLNVETSEILQIDNTNRDLTKSLIIESIISKNYKEKYLKSLNFDMDVFYILCFKYFMNGHGQDKLLRIDTFFQDLKTFEGKDLIIDLEGYNLLEDLFTSNITSIKVDHQPDPFIFRKTIEIIGKVDQEYERFSLVGMLRVLRNAETGFERVEKNDLVKFNIGYYRYLIIEQALNEWDVNFLTVDVWDKYNFKQQWKTIWEIYYQNDSILPPGGPTTMSRVSRIVNY